MSGATEYVPQNPLIVQGDHTVLLEVDNPCYTEARDALARFAELVKSPEHVHTYRVTPLSIWNACAVSETAESIVATLRQLSKYPLPGHVAASVRDFAARYGCLKLTRQDDGTLLLRARDLPLAEELTHQKSLAAFLPARPAPLDFVVPAAERGRLKQALIKLGFPTEDLAGYVRGEDFPLTLRSLTLAGMPFAPRDYQRAAAEVFHAGGAERGGSGVVVLPCGAGKTIVGMACMALVRTSTLILTTNVTAARQWKAELLDKTTLAADAVGEYTGDAKEVRPITIATYQIITHRRSKDGEFTHFALFDERNWGLIIYDEVHLLPAPVFQITASLQARRRLGLTATLVREDGKEDDVFALIGPKKYDVPWKEMEKQGLDRHRHLHGNPPAHDRAAPDGIRRGGGAAQVPHRLGESGEAADRTGVARTPPRRAGADHRDVCRASGGVRARVGPAAAHRWHQPGEARRGLRAVSAR
jgi:DNA excision repair protein ERCC-3